MKRILFTPVLFWLLSVVSPALAQPPTLTFTTDAADLTLIPAESVGFDINVMIGGGATSWRAEVTKGGVSAGGFVNVIKQMPDGTPRNRIRVSYSDNADPNTGFREGEITLTSVGGTGPAVVENNLF